MRREVELLQIDRDNARDAAHAWNLDRSAKEAELRRLDALSAALRAELREQQDSHQQRLADLQGSRDELRRSSPSWPGRFSTSANSASPKTSQERLGQLLDPLKDASSPSKSVSKKAIRMKPANAFPWARSLNACSN